MLKEDGENMSKKPKLCRNCKRVLISEFQKEKGFCNINCSTSTYCWAKKELTKEGEK